MQKWQMSIEDWLCYMPLPVEESEECKGGKEENVYDANSR